ncbi:MAG: chemotaxis protein CheW [Nevskia sp.]
MNTETAEAAIDWEALRERPFDLLLMLEQRLRHARQDLTADESTSWTGLGFRLHGLWFAAPREDVREVSVMPKLTRIPGAKPWLLGVANVRGNLLPVTDLAQLLGMPRPAVTRNQRVLVLNSEGLPAGFLVDEVAGYRQFAPGDQRHELAVGTGPLQAYLLGAFQRDGRDWLALSLRKLARSESFAHAAV